MKQKYFEYRKCWHPILEKVLNVINKHGQNYEAAKLEFETMLQALKPIDKDEVAQYTAAEAGSSSQ